MVVSVNNRFRTHGNRIGIYIVCIGSFVGAILSFKNPLHARTDLIPLVIMLAIVFVVHLPMAIVKMIKVLKFRNLRRKGIKNQYGELVEKVWHGNKNLAFYYKLEDGRIGKTVQQISERTAYRLEDSDATTVPIVINGIRALFDEKKFLKDKEPHEDADINLSQYLHKIRGRRRYGKICYGVLWFSISFLGIVYAIVFPMLMSKGSILDSRSLYVIPLIISIFFNPIVYVGIVLGFMAMRNSFYIPKIRDENRRQYEADPSKPQEYGTLIPLRNTKKKFAKFTRGNKIAFEFKGEDGNYYQAIQSATPRLRRKINQNLDDRIEILVWQDQAILDEEIIFAKQISFVQKIINFWKDHRLGFYVLLTINLYFLTTELIDLFGSNFKATVSLFSSVMYLMTIFYIIVMFIFERLKKHEIHSYWITILYLAANMIILPSIYLRSSANDEMVFTSNASQMLQISSAVSIFTFILYAAYLFIKLLFRIIKSRQAKALGEHYNRCEAFGYIVSSFYTLIVFVLHVVTLLIAKGDGLRFDEAQTLHITFIVLISGMSILSFVLLVKCLVGMFEMLGPKEKKNT